MSVILIKLVNFGASKSGLSTVGYTLLNTDETTKQARTTTGVYEVGINTGIYACNVIFDDDWNGSILWDSGEVTPVYAAEQYNHQENVSTSDISGIADAVWDENLNQHQTANSTGYRLRHVGGGMIKGPLGVWTTAEKEDIIETITKIEDRLKKIIEMPDDSMNSVVDMLKEMSMAIKGIPLPDNTIKSDIKNIETELQTKVNIKNMEKMKENIVKLISRFDKLSKEMLQTSKKQEEILGLKSEIDAIKKIIISSASTDTLERLIKNDR